MSALSQGQTLNSLAWSAYFLAARWHHRWIWYSNGNLLIQQTGNNKNQHYIEIDTRSDRSARLIVKLFLKTEEITT